MTTAKTKGKNTDKIGPIFGVNILWDDKPYSGRAPTKKAAKPTKTMGKTDKPSGKTSKSTGRTPKPVQTDFGPWDISKFQVEEVEGKTRFHDFPLPDSVMRGISSVDFKYCTPIQAGVLTHTLAGRDATGRAQTGTGKTAAFLVTIFKRLLEHRPKMAPGQGTPRALIIAPTRELVIQIAEDARNIGKFTGLNIVAVYGGMDYQKQRRQLIGQRVDIVVATPGRLLDFQRQQDLNLGKVETFIIDEADRMLDMGFIPDVRQIVYSLPQKNKRQTLLFSATLTPEVNHLAAQWTKDPVVIEIEPEQVTVDSVEEVVYMVTTAEKFPLVYNIINSKDMDRVIIFGNRRDETRRLTEDLRRCNIRCSLLSGDIPQNKRQRTLEDFKAGKIKVLIATDVAGRGIHVKGVSHVINFNLPYEPEDYVHRIGRTGRAGEKGTSISFACEEDSFYLPDIEEYIGHKLECLYPDEAMVTVPADIKRQKKRPPKKTGRPGRPRRNNTRK